MSNNNSQQQQQSQSRVRAPKQNSFGSGGTSSDQQMTNAASSCSSSSASSSNNPAATAAAATTATTTKQPPSAASSSTAFAKDEIDIVFNRLMVLDAFRKLHPNVIRNLCSYAFIERIDKGVIVFRQGDDAINWYALLEGSVDVRVSQSGGQKDGVTLCTLGVGATFGASVTPGKSHCVSVVTNEECTLLRVRRADFQEIFNEQSHLIKDVESSPFCSFNALNNFNQPAASFMQQQQQQPPPPGQQQQELAGPQSAPNRAQTAPSSNLKAHQRANKLLLFNHQQQQQQQQQQRPSSASASVATSQGQQTPQATQPGTGPQSSQQQQHQQLQQIEQKLASTQLQNSDAELQAQLQLKLQQQKLFRWILSKRPVERAPEEIDIIFEELQHLKALSHLTQSVKKQLAACVQGEHHGRQNTVIFNQGDVGHSWYIILQGSVNVVIVGKGVVCTLHAGDDFGKLALVNDAPRAATIVTSEANCYFLRVDKNNFNTILRDVEANTVRLKEHGKEVLVLQKVAITSREQQQQLQPSTALAASHAADPDAASADSASQLAQSSHSNSVSSASQNATATSSAILSANNSSNIQQAASTSLSSAATSSSSSALKYMVMAGTAEKMLEHLLETRIDGHTQTGPLHLLRSGLFQHDQVASYIQSHGDNFLEDFILTHGIFMPTANLCTELLKQYQQSQAKHGGRTPPRTRADQEAPPQQASANNKTPQPLDNQLDDEYLVAKKRRVVKFVRLWMLITREHFFQQQQIQAFLTALHQKVKLDAQRFQSLQPELNAITRILEFHLEENLDSRHRGVQRWIDDIYGNILSIRRLTGCIWTQPEQLNSGGLGLAGMIDQAVDLNNNSIGAANGSSTAAAAAAASQTTTLNKQVNEQFLASLHRRRFEHKLSTIQAEDELVFRVYCADHTFTTLKTRFDEQANQIKQLAARNLQLDDKELILVHVKSNGERIIYNDLERNISTCLSVNGRLFVCPLDHIDAISPLPEQDPFQEVYQTTCQPMVANGCDQAAAQLANNGTSTSSSSFASQQQDTNSLLNGQQATSVLPNNSNYQQQQQYATTMTTQQQQQTINQLQQQQQQQQTSPINSHLLSSTPINYGDIKLQMGLSVGKLEEFSSRDVAYCLTQLAWSLLKNMHEFELIYTVFGRHNFKQITANLNVFLRHFNEIQYWVVTQICLSQSLSKRVQILRKFIKIAAHCKELQNLNAFFAIIMGLSNTAVARLTQTWERLPNKLKRTFSQFETQIDPSRNHRRYRLFVSKLEPPIVPFMPLFLKDMTFAHEGNKTYYENGLINFEKMQMVAQTLRTLRHCKSRSMKLDSSVCKFKGSIRGIELFFRDLKIIDNQRTLTQMSHQLEHRKT